MPEPVQMAVVPVAGLAVGRANINLGYQRSLTLDVRSPNLRMNWGF